MKNLEEIKQFIRFQLEQLSVHNAHHKFEDLSRHFARQRICSNVLPATGPVSQGGDQGRDFETFRTYLNESPVIDSSFIGLISKGPIVFACSITKKEDIKRKIKDDIKSITAYESKILEIKYFCVADIPVSVRHELQQWSEEKYNVKLEIFDGQALSEQLASPDIFWIAVKFLNTPAEMYPDKKDEENNWYKQILETWKSKSEKPKTYADFFEIKRATRFSTFSEDAKHDLPFWIDTLKSLTENTPFLSLKKSTFYEIAVSSLRGLGSLIGYEKQISEYFEETLEKGNFAQVEDSIRLLAYCSGAVKQNVLQLDPEVLSVWRKNLVKKLQKDLQKAKSESRKCVILNLLGFINFIPDPRDEDNPDLEKAIKYWLKLTKLVDRAPLFPLEAFSNNLTQYLDIADDIYKLSKNRKFLDLTNKVDKLLSERFGAFKAAEKCRNRALIFRKKGNILRAIKELHKAKINWFTAETLEGSILSALFVMDCYLELGLAYAAKYYGLAVAYISFHERNQRVKKFISLGLINSALCDYLHGAFVQYFKLTNTGLLTFGCYSRDVDPGDPATEINKTLFHASIIRLITSKFNPALTSYVDNEIKKWKGLEEYFKEAIASVEQTWEDKNNEEMWAIIEEQLLGKPFGDIDEKRNVTFKALGVKWIFTWDNKYMDSVLAEEFISKLQILLADLADQDLCLMRTKVVVDVESGEDIKLESVPSNIESKWKLILTENMDQIEVNLLSVGIKLLISASLLPENQFSEYIENALREGLSSKTFFADRYLTLYKKFISEEDYGSNELEALKELKIERKFKSRFKKSIKWIDKPGPTYDKESITEILTNRYERPLLPIKFTLNRLCEDKKIKETINSLKEEGWLDWQILNAIANIVINYRIKKTEDSSLWGPSEWAEHLLEYMNKEESADEEIVPNSIFSKESFKDALKVLMCSSLKNLGLEIHQRTPDFSAIKDFLEYRYFYFSDDIEHPTPGF